MDDSNEEFAVLREKVVRARGVHFHGYKVATLQSCMVTSLHRYNVAPFHCRTAIVRKLR